ncbi:MAG: hypothetical protein AAF268_02405 [Cyanobacteria bacterium P01_A01_bin.3]
MFSTIGVPLQACLPPVKTPYLWGSFSRSPSRPPSPHMLTLETFSTNHRKLS